MSTVRKYLQETGDPKSTQQILHYVNNKLRNGTNARQLASLMPRIDNVERLEKVRVSSLGGGSHQTGVWQFKETEHETIVTITTVGIFEREQVNIVLNL
jgi:hypothetical protein